MLFCVGMQGGETYAVPSGPARECRVWESMHDRLPLDRPSNRQPHTKDPSLVYGTHTKKAVKGGEPPDQVRSYTCTKSAS